MRVCDKVRLTAKGREYVISELTYKIEFGVEGEIVKRAGEGTITLVRLPMAHERKPARGFTQNDWALRRDEFELVEEVSP